MDKITLVVMFLGILIFFSHLLNKLFNKTKIPNVLILLILGIAVGFFIDKEIFFGELGRVFTTITLIIILFESGAGLKLSELKSSIASATSVTIINFILTTLVVMAVTMFFIDLDFTAALFLGSILGGTSSAVVIPMVRQLKIGQKAGTVLFLESAFTDVLCLVVGLAALEGMRAGNLDPEIIINKMWQSFLFAALLGFAAGIIWSIILNLIRNVKNSMFTTFAFLFIVYGAAELLNLNGGIAALTLGIVLGNSEYFDKIKWWKRIFHIEVAKLTDSEKNFFSEIVFVLQTYFFVYVGAVIEFGSVTTYLLALTVVVLIVILRIPVIKIFVRKNCSKTDKIFMTAMAPKGLVPAVLASIPLQQGLMYGLEIAEFAYAVVLVSIVFCSLLIIIISNVTKSSSKYDAEELKKEPNIGNVNANTQIDDRNGDIQ